MEQAEVKLLNGICKRLKMVSLSDAAEIWDDIGIPRVPFSKDYEDGFMRLLKVRFKYWRRWI